MRRIYQVTGLVFLAIGIFIAVESTNLKFYTDMGPGAGFFPLLIGIGMSALSVVWLGQVTLRPDESMEEGFLPNRSGTIRILSIVAALVALVVLQDHLGYRVTMFAFLVFLLYALGRQNLLVTVLVALAGSFGIYYVFDHWLQVTLPAASVEFLSSLGL